MRYRADRIGEGFVYMMRSTDNDLANRVKVGLSTNCEIRRRQLYTSGVAMPFYLHFAWAVSNMAFAEHIAHNELAAHRVVNTREFFDIYTPEISMSIFGQIKPPYEEHYQIGLQLLEQAINVGFQVNRASLEYYAVDIDFVEKYSIAKNQGVALPLFG